MWETIFKTRLLDSNFRTFSLEQNVQFICILHFKKELGDVLLTKNVCILYTMTHIVSFLYQRLDVVLDNSTFFNNCFLKLF